LFGLRAREFSLRVLTTSIPFLLLVAGSGRAFLHHQTWACFPLSKKYACQESVLIPFVGHQPTQPRTTSTIICVWTYALFSICCGSVELRAGLDTHSIRKNKWLLWKTVIMPEKLGA
jgi:hypothetical protein